jgi:hypothetical protein
MMMMMMIIMIPIDTTELGTLTDDNEEHPLNAFEANI